MNINAAIIDQRLKTVCEAIRQRARDELGINDDARLKSLAFVFFLVRTVEDLSDEDAFDCLTEGGGDFGVDAMHLSEEKDGEFTVALFQAKYKQSLEGTAIFPENGIKALINAIRYLFDPTSSLESGINTRLLAKIEEVRSLIRDGYLPRVRAVACNNGLKWNEAAEEEITRARFGNQVTWEYVNHDHLVMILQATKPVNDFLRLSGKAIVEDLALFGFRGRGCPEMEEPVVFACFFLGARLVRIDKKKSCNFNLLCAISGNLRWKSPRNPY